MTLYTHISAEYEVIILHYTLCHNFWWFLLLATLENGHVIHNLTKLI